MKGFVSIFQLLGRYIRRISVIFQPDLTTRDKQHVRLPILRNLEVHKPRMRKTYLNLYLTEPLRRITEPLKLQRITEPLRRNIEPHCGIIEPLWRNIMGKHDLLSHCGNIASVYSINKSFSGNRNPTLQGESACQTTERKSFSDRETIDMKAVASDSESSYEIIIPGNCELLDVNNDRSSNEPSVTVYRLTARKLCKQSKINRHMHSRNREPSRIPVKRVIQTMRKRKLRKKLKSIIRKSIPTSSKLFHLITNYKLWYTDHIHRNLYSFYTTYFRSQLSCACKNYWKNIKSKQYSVSDKKFLLSGDIK